MTRDQFMRWLFAELEDPSKWEPGEPMVSDLEHTQTGRSLNVRTFSLCFDSPSSINITRKERKRLRQAIRHVQKNLKNAKDFSHLAEPPGEVKAFPNPFNRECRKGRGNPPPSPESRPPAIPPPPPKTTPPHPFNTPT